MDIRHNNNYCYFMKHLFYKCQNFMFVLLKNAVYIVWQKSTLTLLPSFSVSPITFSIFFAVAFNIIISNETKPKSRKSELQVRLTHMYNQSVWTSYMFECLPVAFWLRSKICGLFFVKKYSNLKNCNNFLLFSPSIFCFSFFVVYFLDC